MNKIVIIIIIISLFFIEGCSFIGYSIGKEIQMKNSLEIEKIESIPKDQWLTISLKNNEIIKVQFISCANDTLLVTYPSPKTFTPISNNQFLTISHNKAFYKIPVDQINDIHIGKARFGLGGAILGLVIDIIILVYIIPWKSVGTYQNLRF